MKKLETHFHTSPVSVCSRLTAEDAAEKYAACGFNAVMLTNHYSRSYIERNGVSEKEWLDAYIAAYREMLAEGAKRGLEVFLGAEVTLFAPYCQYMRDRYSAEFLAQNYADYILIGVTEEFLADSPMLCDLDLKELRAVCHDNGVLAVQAHPFRTEQNHSLKDVSLLDGLEINGCVGFSTSCEKEVLSVAAENGLIVTCGGDTHCDWHKLRSAVFVPDDVNDSVALARYLEKVRVPRYSLSEADPFAPSKE